MRFFFLNFILYNNQFTKIFCLFCLYLDNTRKLFFIFYPKTQKKAPKLLEAYFNWIEFV
jgi:hypothetical protein